MNKMNEKEETKSKKKETKTPSNSNIYLKLQKVQSEVKELIRTEENKAQKYNFFNELQVLKHLKPLLDKNKLLILLSDDENKEFKQEKIGNMYLVQYWKIMEVFNAENPEERVSFSFVAIGQNNDPAKAKGSAETYAVKYFLSKLFLIPVKNEMDPDYSPRETESEENLLRSSHFNKNDQNLLAKKVDQYYSQTKPTLNQVDALMNFLVQKRGNSKEIQTNFLKEVDKLMPKYRIVGETAPGNLRGRVNLLKEEDYQTL